MEKLNIKILQTIAVLVTFAFTSTAFANKQFRMSSKSPVVEPAPRLTGYFFGYGGISFGSSNNTTGSFDNSTGYYGASGVTALGLDPNAFPVNFDLQDGVTWGGGLGMYSSFLNGSRFEIEGSVGSRDVGSVNYGGLLLPSAFRLRTKTAMVNFLKEFPIGGATGYAGFGVGYATTEMRGDIGGVPYNTDSDGFAWQLLVGIDVPVTERLALFTQYRYRVLDNQTFYSTFNDFSINTNDNPSNHSVEFGLRVSF